MVSFRYFLVDAAGKGVDTWPGRAMEKLCDHVKISKRAVNMQLRPSSNFEDGRCHLPGMRDRNDKI
tara:strand:- start:188 stop:385 length:198 start_codon:yes stop_codon:yes gene_type:complete